MLSSAVIVGGSLSGLIHGLYLKRQGFNVTILEQDVNNERSSQNAGIQISGNILHFLHQNDDTGVRLSAESNYLLWSFRKQSLWRIGSVRYWSNWGYLYRILRANFDGLSSKACPEPPTPNGRDGRAVYLTGKRVVSLSHGKNGITLDYVDEKGKESTITSDLVIGADGAHSSVRKLVKAPQAEPEQYAGYVAWRGSIPVKHVSRETANFFLGRICFDLLGSRTYILCHVIPTDRGDFEEEELLLNWLLYTDLVEDTPEEEEIFTDIHGHRCQRSIPQGLVSSAAWEKRRDALMQRMANPFAELVKRSPTPFVAKVYESLGSRASFCDGRVVLVGDALASYRPNIGRATDQAAAHCLSFAKVLQGEKGIEEWDREVCVEAKRVALLARLTSELTRGSWVSLLLAAVAYLWFDLTSRAY